MSITNKKAVPYVSPGSSITGRIYIEIVKPDGTTIDVMLQILSVGVTEVKPNGIVYSKSFISFAKSQRA